MGTAVMGHHLVILQEFCYIYQTRGSAFKIQRKPIIKTQMKDLLPQFWKSTISHLQMVAFHYCGASMAPVGESIIITLVLTKFHN